MTPRFAILLMLVPLGLPGQEAPFDYARAMAMARAQAPLLAAAAGRRQTIEGRAKAEAALPNPTWEFRRENIGAPLTRDEFSQFTVPIDLTGRRVLTLAALGAARDRAVADSASFARALLFEVARTWWRASLATAAHEAMVEHVRALDEIARWDARRASEGAIAVAAAYRTRLEADRSHLAEAAARAELSRARTELARLLGLAADQLPPLPLPSRVDTPLGPAVDTAAALALRDRPEAALTRAASREAAWRARAERQGVIADASIIAGTKVTGGYASRLLGVQLPVPLFNWNGGNRERTGGERRIAEAEQRDTELRLAGEARAAARAYSAQRDAAAVAIDGMRERAADVAVAADAAYREGAATIVELLDARRTALDATLAAWRGLAELALARIDLARAVGAPLPEFN